jgi:acetoin utilization protein AcuB
MERKKRGWSSRVEQGELAVTTEADMTAMKVQELMNAWCMRAREDDDLGLATQMMLWSGARHLPVVRDTRVLGVLSERDILDVTLTAGQQAAFVLVSEAMSSPAETIGPDEDARTAAARMLADGIGCLPVVEAGAFLGMLSTTDLLRHDVAGAARRPAAGPPTLDAVMSHRLIAVTPATRLAEAAALMEANVVRHLPVIDPARRVVGILSDRDVSRMDGPRAGETTVAHAMTRDVVTVGREASLPEVAVRLAERRIGAIPVVDADGLLVGIVSYVDVLRGLAR